MKMNNIQDMIKNTIIVPLAAIVPLAGKKRKNPFNEIDTYYKNKRRRYQ
jgi:hypothetical protein